MACGSIVAPTGNSTRVAMSRDASASLMAGLTVTTEGFGVIAPLTLIVSCAAMSASALDCEIWMP